MSKKSEPLRTLFRGVVFIAVAVSQLLLAYRTWHRPLPGLVETTPGVWQQGYKPSDQWMFPAGAGALLFVIGIWEVITYFKRRGDAAESDDDTREREKSAGI
jgi:hypothetical protein